MCGNDNLWFGSVTNISPSTVFPTPCSTGFVFPHQQYFPLSTQLDLWRDSPVLNIQMLVVAPNCVLSTGSS